MTDFARNPGHPTGTEYQVLVPASCRYDIDSPERFRTQRAWACPWSPPRVDPIKGMSDEQFFDLLFGA